MSTYEVGDTAVLTVTVQPADIATDATVTVTAPNSATTMPVVTPGTVVDGTRTFTADIELDQAGTWVAVWTATGIGAGVQSDVLTVNALPTPSEPGSETSYVRLLISDTDSSNPIFSDTEIRQFIGHSSSPKRAAADALDAIAINEALILKVIRTQDLSTDGAKLADTLMKRAAQLRQDSDDDEDQLSGGFLIEPFQPNGNHELVERPWYA